MLPLAALGLAFGTSLLLRIFVERRPDAELDRRYRLVAPALTGVACSLVTLRATSATQAGIYSLLLTLAILLAVCNAEDGLFPDRLSVPGMVLGCFLCPWLAGRGALDGVYGALAGGGIGLVLRVWSRGGFGGGDIKVLAMIGAFVGPGIKPILIESFVFVLLSIPVWLFAQRRGSRAMANLNVEQGQIVRHDIPTGPGYASAVFFQLALGPELAAHIPEFPGSNAWWT